MKENLHRWKNSTKQKLARVIFATSMIGGVSPMPHAVSVGSCESFLSAYTPQIDQKLLDAQRELSFQTYTFFTVYPDIADAKSTLAITITAIENQPLADELPLRKLKDVQRRLAPPDGNTLLHMRDTTHVTFAKERRDILDAEKQLYQIVTSCEQTVPALQRRDNWYRKEQETQLLNNLWEKYKVELFLIACLVGADILERLFIGEKRE